MFRFSKSMAVPPGDQLVNRQRRTSDPPPLPAFRVSKTTAAENDGKIESIRGNLSSVVNSSSAPSSSSSFTDAAPPSPSGDVRRNGTQPTKVGIHHQWLAQIQNAVRSASGRYRKQRRAASIDHQQHQTTMAASSSLDRSAFKNRKHKTATLTKDDRHAIVGNIGLNDDVIRSRANKYYTVTEGARGVVVEMLPTETGSSVSSSLPLKAKSETTVTDVSNCRKTLVAEAGTRSGSRDPSPMTSSGYASDGMYTYHRGDMVDDTSWKEHTLADGNKLQAAEVPFATSGYHSSTIPSNPTAVTAAHKTSNDNSTGNTTDFVHNRNYRREISASKAENLYTSGHTTSSSGGFGSKYNDSTRSRRKPVYENLLNQACVATKERKSNDASSNRRYSIQPGSLQHKTTLAEFRRMSMGPYLQPIVVDNSGRISDDDWRYKGANTHTHTNTLLMTVLCQFNCIPRVSVTTWNITNSVVIT